MRYSNDIVYSSIPFKKSKTFVQWMFVLMISRCASFCLLYFPSQSNFICFYWRTFYILIQVLKWENNPLLIKLNREVTGIESWYPGRYMKAENIKWEAKLWINHIPSFSKYRGRGDKLTCLVFLFLVFTMINKTVLK